MIISSLNPSTHAIITILLDHGYHPEYLTQKLEQIYPKIMKKIKFERKGKTIVARIGCDRGFLESVPVAARWGKRTVKCLDF